MTPPNDSSDDDNTPNHPAASEPDVSLNPFRQARRERRDAEDAARAEIRDQVEPVPDVQCTMCTDRGRMTYQRQLSSPQPDADAPLIEATWECESCNGLAYGYVTPDGLTPILDNARPLPDE